MEWFNDPVHKKIVGVGLLIVSVLQLFGVLILLFIAPLVGRSHFFTDLSIGVLSFDMGSLAGGLLFIAGALAFVYTIWTIITAVLILANKKAGYIMGIIICFFSLFNFPVGTILGLYGLLVLISALKEKENSVLTGREYIR
jgi:hypothetical protein